MGQIVDRIIAERLALHEARRTNDWPTVREVVPSLPARLDGSPAAVEIRRDRIAKVSQNFLDLVMNRGEAPDFSVSDRIVERTAHRPVELGSFTDGDGLTTRVAAVPFIETVPGSSVRGLTVYGLDLRHTDAPGVWDESATSIVRSVMQVEPQPGVNPHDAADYVSFERFASLLGEVVQLDASISIATA